MKKLLKIAAPLAAALAVASCSSGGSSNVPAAGVPAGTHAAVPTGQSVVVGQQLVSPHLRQLWGGNVAPACGAPRFDGTPQCLALVQTDIPARMTPLVSGLGPADIQSAYNLPSAQKGNGQIVAIVDAFDNPNVASDLATYRQQFGLPPANFKKFNQYGEQGNYPPGDTGWGVEIDLDVEAVSAACPKCTIYLIESGGDLDVAEKEAVTLGAHIVSNSWISYGCPSCDDPSAFAAPGVVYLAGSGDIGYGSPGTPMALANVVAVGGTTLHKGGGGKRGWTETAWDGSGSGCATGVAKPSWQHDPNCTYRMTADVAADADPSGGSGFAEYDTYGYGGWFVEGGTSLATPLLAGVYALAGDAASQNAGQAFWQKTAKTRHLYVVKSGNNGSCSPSYFCTDGTHEYKSYGGPDGWGTPHGLGAF
ncbi:MAG TPA: S8 family serine peptidase [Candidatus Tumulicola sp.]